MGVLIIQGIYSLVTNLYLAKSISGTNSLDLSGIDVIISEISLDSKVQASNQDSASTTSNLLYLIDMWIGVGLVVLWSLFLYIIRYF